ncbi:MAG: 30S ribosomal protein S4 [Deltaproteobacteria bacterium]|nr:MAG: 30S ribosomal protein S4 [Deltaproteobacteria bacterium]
MARYTESSCRLCRRENAKLFLKGDRCFTDKCAFERRPYPPGQHGRGRRKFSDYAIQLREKQKTRRIYGVLEKQFRRYFQIADKKRGITGENLLFLLEKRLDNVVFLMGFAVSRNQARQLVSHGHVRVNGRKVDVGNYQVKVGDKIQIKEKSRKNAGIQEALELASKRGGLPQWLEVNADAMEGVIKAEPTREDVRVSVNEQLIVELYSK